MAEIIILIISLQRMALWPLKTSHNRMNRALKAEDPSVKSDLEETKRRSSSNPLITLWEEKT